MHAGQTASVYTAAVVICSGRAYGGLADLHGAQVTSASGAELTAALLEDPHLATWRTWPPDRPPHTVVTSLTCVRVNVISACQYLS